MPDPILDIYIWKSFLSTLKSSTLFHGENFVLFFYNRFFPYIIFICCGCCLILLFIWFTCRLAELCLAINLIPLIRDDFSNNSLLHKLYLQQLIELIDWMVDSFNPSLFRKEFLHPCILVKHAIARLLSELHKLLDYIVWLDCTDSSRVEFLKEEIQNHVQALLRALFPLQCSGHFCMWRFPSPAVNWEVNTKEEYVIRVVGEIWDVNMSVMTITFLEELLGYLYFKVQEALITCKSWRTTTIQWMMIR